MRYSGFLDPASGCEYGGGYTKSTGYLGSYTSYRKKKRNIKVLNDWKYTKSRIGKKQ